MISELLLHLWRKAVGGRAGVKVSLPFQPVFAKEGCGGSSETRVLGFGLGGVAPFTPPAQRPGALALRWWGAYPLATPALSTC